MTRDAGQHSEARLARYAFASGLLPTKGQILDTASELDGVMNRSHFPPRSVDAVVSLETIERVADAPALLRQLRRVMKNDARIVASVPYRAAGSGPGPHDLDWYDARKLLALFSRFFIVDDMWCQAEGAVSPSVDAPPTWQRLRALGAEPDEPTEWLVITARRADIRTRGRRTDWVFLAPGVPQLSTMLAAMHERKIAPGQVTVWGCSPVTDDGFHQAMREAAEAFGTRYEGNLFVAPDVTDAGDLLEFRPDDPTARANCGARILHANPVLESLRGCRLMMPARPNVLSDYALLAAASPDELRLVADGIQNELIVRDVRGAAGFVDNPLACIPTPSPVSCPPWLETETAAIGRAWVLPERQCRDVLARIGKIPSLAALRDELLDGALFSGVVVSQHLSLTGMMSADTELAFYLHQIRKLLKDLKGRILFKAHPRDPHGKLAALERALGTDVARVRITQGVESHAPLESLTILNSTKELMVWGTSSSALLGVRDWPLTRVACVDADYLEGEARRQALQFSRRHRLEHMTLSFSDPMLTEENRAALRRRMKLAAHAPAVGVTTALRLHTATFESTIAVLDQKIAAFEREHHELDALREAIRKYSRALVIGGQRPLVVWGAGAGGRRIRALLPFQILAIVDNDPSKTGTTLDDAPVLSPASLKHPRLRDAFVVAASMYAGEIAEQLTAMGRIQDADFIILEAGELAALETAYSDSSEPHDSEHVAQRSRARHRNARNQDLRRPRIASHLKREERNPCEPLRVGADVS